MQAGKSLCKRIRLRVDDEVDAALAIERHRLVAMFGNRLEAHALEELAHRLRVRRGVLDELESVGAHGVVPGRWLLGCEGVQCLVHGRFLGRG